MEIPQFGFGVFQVPPDETAETVRAALDAGYRHFELADDDVASISGLNVDGRLGPDPDRFG